MKDPNRPDRPGPVTFVGIDLAWSVRNLSGVVVIQDNCPVAWSGTLTDDRAILDYVAPFLATGAAAVAAVDAPLRVPNETGSRACDRALSAQWSRYEAGALPGNRRLLARNGSVRGEALVAALSERFGFVESACVPLRSEARLVCEVYPHPAHVSLFGLERTLKYKRRGARAYPDRWVEFGRYQHYLRRLQAADPRLVGTEVVLGRDVVGLRGRALQEYEEILDALTCAYVALYLWHHGPAYARTYGNVADGHILVPVTPAMVDRLVHRADRSRVEVRKQKG